MKEAGFLILVSLTAFVIGAPSGNPAIQLQAEFDPHNVKGISGTASLTSNEISLAAARGREGKVALGVGVQETGVIPIGGYGSINLKGMSTLDGMYQALIETELFTGQRSFSPFQLTVMKSPNGLQYSGSSSLGYLSGFYEGSDGSFVINLDTDGFVTANAFGVYSDRKVTWKGYNASVDLGIVSGAINLDDQMKLLNYELGGSLGILHGAMLRNQETKGTSYRAGLNLGIVNFEALFKEDKTQAYSTQLDTGMLRFAFNADPNKNDYDWSGTLDMANMMVEYARDKKGGFTIGGRMQIGNSVIGVQRNPNGIFTVKIDKK